MATLHRVKVKYKLNDGAEKTAIERKLLECLANQNILVADIKESYGGYSLYVADDKSFDHIYLDTTAKVLGDAGFTLYTPPEVKCRKCIIIKNVQGLADHDVLHIKQDIERIQSWASVTEVIRFPKGHTYKVMFRTQDMAATACRQGLKVLNLSLTPAQLEVEQFIPLTVCFRCYQIEGHTTKECTKPQDYKVCSICAETDHTWQECDAGEQKCVLCSGQHSCMAMKCPKRKQALKDKRARVNASKLKPNQLYSYVANNNQTYPQPGSLENQLKVAAITATALSQEQRTPGTYQAVIRTLSIENGLPSPANTKSANTALAELAQTLQALVPSLSTTAIQTRPPPTAAGSAQAVTPTQTNDESPREEAPGSQLGQRSDGPTLPSPPSPPLPQPSRSVPSTTQPCPPHQDQHKGANRASTRPGLRSEAKGATKTDP